MSNALRLPIPRQEFVPRALGASTARMADAKEPGDAGLIARDSVMNMRSLFGGCSFGVTPNGVGTAS